MTSEITDAVNARRQGDRSSDIDMSYWTVQPNKWTFEADKIREWVESYLRGRVLNICAGKVELQHDDEIVRNDIDEDRNAEHHVDAKRAADYFGENKFDTVVFDPPFSANQATVTYNGKTTGYDTAMKQEIHRLLRNGGRVIQLGYTTTCMPLSLEYKRTAVAVFNTLGRQNDILGAVDDRASHDVTAGRWDS